MNIIAVVNDFTGEIYAILQGYEKYFENHIAYVSAGYIKEIRQYGEIGEHVEIEIFSNGFKQRITSEKYSFIYE